MGKSHITLEHCLSIDNWTFVFLGVIQLIWMLNKMRSKDSLSSEKQQRLCLDCLIHLWKTWCLNKNQKQETKETVLGRNLPVKVSIYCLFNPEIIPDRRDECQAPLHRYLAGFYHFIRSVLKLMPNIITELKAVWQDRPGPHLFRAAAKTQFVAGRWERTAVEYCLQFSYWTALEPVAEVIL